MEINETKIWTVLVAGEIDRAFISFDRAIKHRNQMRRDHPNCDVKVRWAILEGEINGSKNHVATEVGTDNSKA